MQYTVRILITLVVILCSMEGISAQFPIQPYGAMSDSALNAGDHTRDSDSIQLIILKSYNFRKFDKKSQQKRYDKLMRIVQKVYPLAKLAGQRMEEYARAEDTLRRGQVKDLVAQIEDEVMNKYGADLKRLTFTEGIILLKLLDRQTQHTPYAIIKELKSGFSAMIWQGVASLFDYDLKQGFDPVNVEEDQWIDEICVMIDNGVIGK